MTTENVSSSESDNISTTQPLTRSERRRTANAAVAERERCAAITKLGERFDLRDVASRAISNGTSERQFRDFVVAIQDREEERLERAIGHFPDIAPFGRRDDYQNYSLVRAIGATFDPRGVDAAARPRCASD